LGVACLLVFWRLGVRKGRSAAWGVLGGVLQLGILTAFWRFVSCWLMVAKRLAVWDFGKEDDALSTLSSHQARWSQEFGVCLIILFYEGCNLLDKKRR